LWDKRRKLECQDPRTGATTETASALTEKKKPRNVVRVKGKGKGLNKERKGQFT